MSRVQNDFYTERVVLSFDHPQVTATTTWKVFQAVGRKFKVESCRYINPTGLVEDNSNAFRVSVKNGSTEIAWLDTDANLDPDVGASIAADTFTAMNLAEDTADLVLDPGDVLSLVATETGTATLPAGRVVVEGRYL